VPSILIATIQYCLRDHSKRSPADVWTAIIIVFVVYLVLSMLEGIRNFVLISPMNLHSHQSEIIATLTTENENLIKQQAVPEVPPQEQRRRELVSKEVKKLEPIGRTIIRYIHDQGQVNALALKMDCQFTETDVGKFISKAIPAGLILYQNHIISIKPDLRFALEYVLASEYGQDS